MMICWISARSALNQNFDTPSFFMAIAQTSLVLRHNKTTGHLRGRLLAGGEDKIRTCGRVTPTAV